MGDEPPLRPNPVLTDTEDNLTDPSPHHSLPSTNPSGQTATMEFEQYPRQHFGMPQFAGPGALDMSSMAAALPDYQMRPLQQHSFQHQYQSPAVGNQSMMYQYNQGAQFAGQAAHNYSQTFAQQYPSQFPQGTPPRQPHAAAYPQFIGTPGGSSGPQQFQNQAFMLQQPMFSAPNTAAHHQQQGGYSQAFVNPAYAGGYGTRVAGAYPIPQLRLDSSLTQPQVPNFYQQSHNPAVRRTSSNSSLTTSTLRGPPRKPKQSGHALWVGNLPPATHIIDLKDHFSKDATDDIESVFLISKSNCAFVNYRTEASCAAAMTRFHDSRFQGVRLVCRLRRGSSSPATPAQSHVQSATQLPDGVGDSDEKQEESGAHQETVTGDVVTAEPDSVEKVKEKFFVVKSLTVEDLERSVNSGIWATQAHNEDALNKAYNSAENVYLIFSANKSGEYFGYARMESAIDDESAADIDYQPRVEIPDPSPSDLPLTIPTPATATAPKGRIIDDSARGTIFWEAESDTKEKEVTQEDEGNVSAGEGYESGSPATPQTFGKPFKIKWMSAERLPFYRTRGLRNPWNANREVKIARDGTEIEPSTGRRLIAMFHRPQLPSASPGAPRPQQLPPGPMGGYMSPHASAPGGMYGRSY
ncbi:hypothetical protein, variant 2 [Exophiala sideris]|uniref:YTH domain-containing protein n=1 Tax=Exophiala sideris TaxID=1016849 RepID=A0A0D1WSM7_9EURO|nr:hypothetical protein, variant 1 [Exophiala sideris]KIV78076.1 hypothetical protein, variant 2 [Exophiala sideris]